MNYLIFSPHFPPNYTSFSVRLRQMGVNVLGMADAPYHELRSELKSALTEYYRLNDAHSYDEKVRALGYFTHRYGKLDRLESHNEYWLESDAQLRKDFNIAGFQPEDMERIKRKSKMKKVFIQSGIPVARGKVARSIYDALKLADEIGFPLIAKPDIGVGASKTYKLHNRKELEAFFVDKPPEDYIFEEFIQGEIETFDGLTDQNGKVVFSSAMRFNEGIMDLVNEGKDICYYTLRDIPEDLMAAGLQLAKAYNLRERFFHFEFFRKPDGNLTVLEVNMRPPGGLTTDVWNYANDIDIYQEYANVVINNKFKAAVTRPYFCAYVGRRKGKPYRYGHDEILSAFPLQLVHHEPMSGVFAPALGDYGYVVRSPEFDELAYMAGAILELA
ncbi:MAG: ATP-grasp domain-containing protein [Anaerolineae bacterium]|jgi:hypothetical protein|nr:ATP-grasp domain-containing protein [Anaerolineae bacterium]